MDAITINQIDITNAIIDKIYIFAKECRNKKNNTAIRTICMIIPN